eukprot:9292857-Karenia_brevis.AAC.1
MLMFSSGPSVSGSVVQHPAKPRSKCTQQSYPSQTASFIGGLAGLNKATYQCNAPTSRIYRKSKQD